MPDKLRLTLVKPGQEDECTLASGLSPGRFLAAKVTD